MLEIQLLGAFEISQGGRPIDLPSRVAQSLLAYLVIHRGRPHRREKLAGMFWPDVPEERARASLRHELWRIRKTLAVAGEQNALLTDDITVAFAPSSGYRLDVACLEQAAEEASADELKASLVAYRGELLPGFYEDWVTVERERLLRLFDQGLGRLLTLLETQECWDEVIEWGERWIAVAERPEAAYRALMTAYAALGNRVKALETYERCVDALRALGLEPSEEIRSLVEARRPAANLPKPVTSLIGREAEVREICSLLLAARLVTLTGSGGVGKTRLAIEVAHRLADRFVDGVFYLELASLRDPAMVPQRLLSLLRILQPPTGSHSATDILVGYFGDRHALLILDNCEHLIEACAQLVNVLASACPNLYILSTSREAMRLANENAYRVPSLDVPSIDHVDAPEALASVDSVRLFVERASARSRDFALNAANARPIADISIHLDGIPLAIELAAARAGTLAPESIVEHLDDRFALLSGGLRTDIRRHQTLRAMIDWSHDLLSERERVLLRRLSVFTGGWTLRAAQKVAADAALSEIDVLLLLSELVEKSLVVLNTTTGRYNLLETVREYCLDRLKQAGEEAILRTRHLDYFLAAWEEADLAARQSEAESVQLVPERDNLLSAFAWCEQAEDGIQKALLLIGACRLTWWLFPDIELGFRLARKFLNMPGAEPRNFARCRALETMIQMAFYTGHGTEPDVLAAGEESISIAREIGNGRRESVSLNLHGNVLALAGKPKEALDYLTQALPLAREFGLLRQTGKVLSDMADVLRATGDLAAAVPLYEEGLAFMRRCNAPHDIILSLVKAASVSIALGNLPQARRQVQEALKTTSEVAAGSAITSPQLQTSGFLLAAIGDWRHAALILGAAERQSELENWVLERAQQTLHHPLVEQTHNALGEAAFQAAFAEGRRLPGTKAIAEIQAWLNNEK